MVGFGSQIAFALILCVPVACITWTVTQEESTRRGAAMVGACRPRRRA